MKGTVLTVALLAAALICSGTPGWSDDIHPRVMLTAAGSGANLGITRLLATAFSKHNQNIVLDIPGSIGTRGAIRAVADGAIPLGLISRPLKEDEKALGIVEQPYACVALVIGVHAMVKEDRISSRELNEIYKGTKTRWQDGNQIIVQARERTDSGFAVLEKKIPGFKDVYSESHEAKRWTLYFNDQEAGQALANTPYAIGVTDLGMIATEQLNIKVMKLDDRTPDEKSILDGTYPLSRRLAFIYRRGALSPEGQRFIEFTASEAGRSILRAHGYIPLQ